MQDELQTIRDFFRYFVTTLEQRDLYYGHGTDSAWDEALALIFDTLKLPHEEQKVFLDAKLTKAEKKQLLDSLQKRIKNYIPVPYLTHIAWFAGLPFYVDERVIVPRSPISELIESGFSPWINLEENAQILDLCTGSGCIAIASVLYFPDVYVDAVDISADALAVAEINVRKFNVQPQVKLIQSDLFEKIPNKKYDLIVSNPPYVDAQDMKDLPAEFKHEPSLALASGDDGLNATREILKKAKDYLTDNGVLIVEVGNSQLALMEEYADMPFVWLDFERGGHGVFLLTREQLNGVINV